jgi:hypothetical protein
MKIRTPILILLVAFGLGHLAVGPAMADNIFGRWFGRSTIDGSGDLVTETREVDSFRRIKSSGGLDIYVTIGDAQSVTLTIDDNLADLVRTRVRGQTLKVDTDGRSIDAHRRSRLEITVPELEEVTVTGSGDAEVRGGRSDLLEISITGSGDIELLDLDYEELIVQISGSGDVRADGQAEYLDIGISGSGDVDARDLEAVDARVKISGSGDVKVFAHQRLDVRVFGSGDVVYYGNPEEVDQYASGSGSIRRRR